MPRLVIFGPIYDDLIGCAKSVERMVDFELRKHGLTMGRYSVLRAIERAGGKPITHTDILRGLAITQPTLTGHVTYLKKQKLIVSERKTKGGDRREKGLMLTPAGVGLLLDVSYPTPCHPNGLTGAEDDILAPLLRKLRKGLELRCTQSNLARVKAPLKTLPPPPAQIDPQETLELH